MASRSDRSTSNLRAKRDTNSSYKIILLSIKINIKRHKHNFLFSIYLLLDEQFRIDWLSDFAALAGFAAVQTVENVVTVVTCQQLSPGFGRRKISRSGRQWGAAVGSVGASKKKRKILIFKDGI